MKIIISNDIEEISFIKSGKILQGIIYIEEGSFRFPSKNWIDNPIIILGWWIDNFLKYSNKKRSYENCFMEGPFRFMISPKNKDFHISFIKEIINKDIIIGPILIVNKSDFAKELIDISQEIIKAHNIHIDTNRDFQKLCFLTDKLILYQKNL